MAATLSEIDEIRRHMAQIRHELHQDVQGVVRGARSDCGLAPLHPELSLAAMGVAFGVGYLLVPRRQPKQNPIVHYAPAPLAEAAKAVTSVAEPEKKKGKGLWKTALGLAAPFVVRTAQGYALQFFEQYLAQKMAQQQSPFADLASSFMNQNPGSPAGSAPLDPIGRRR